MVETVAGVLGLVVVLGGIALGIWALRHQSRQYPKDARIPDEERKSESRSSAWMNLGGRG